MIGKAEMVEIISTLDEAVVAFIEGARIYHVALSIDDMKMARRGLLRTQDSLKYIDQHSPTRDLLLPLLDDKDDGIRVQAASALFQSWPDLALPILQNIADHSVTEAYRTAGMIFVFKNVFGYFSSGIWPDPRYPPLTKPDAP